MSHAPTGLPPNLESMLRAPHRGVTVLVFGILGLTVCFILGIIAWVMANGDLYEMDMGRMDPAGRDLTRGGKLCGMIATFLGIIGMVFVLFAVAVG